ncbi:MAG: carboxypeptidase-like regulatory domain-containing protein [Bacteroidetes bacterium]|nr:carboxypeptidase-like regulatory domain-containing protein [Bacteroidota bacterium]
MNLDARIYSTSDAEMHTAMQTMIDNLGLDLAAFTAVFSWVNGAYKISMQADLDTCLAYPLDTGILDDQRVLTSDVNTSVVEGEDAFSILNIFAELTYPTDKMRQRVFGQDHWQAINGNAADMVDQLMNTHSKANAAPYKAALIAKGYTQTEIDNLLTIRTNIRLKLTLQRDFESQRPITTQGRIQVNNTAYARMEMIHTCAQVVFAGNPAKLNQYRLTPNTSPAATVVRVRLTDSLGNPLGGGTVSLLNAPQFAPQITDAQGYVTFTGSSIPASLDIHADMPGFQPLDSMDNTILHNEVNEIVLVLIP